MIRKMKLIDSRRMPGLLRTLGYPSTEDDLEKRLERIHHHPDYMTYVWEEEGELLGFIGMNYSFAYHTNRCHVRVIAFAVADHAQGKGIGRALMKQAEAWGKSKGASTLMLNSGNRDERKKTHEIYKSWGFEGTATGFYKTVF